MASKVVRRDVLIGAAVFAGALSISTKNVFAETPKTHDIKINSFKFEPRSIDVKVGDTIRWTNEDLAPHTATATEAGWDTGEIAKGDAQSIVVSEGMETSYFCAFHPHMKGMLVIS